MIYVYNQIVNAETYEIEYMGINYKLSGKNHMGDVDYYSYSCEGAEPILLTPMFAEQFLEAAKKISKLSKLKDAKVIKSRLEAMFRKKVEEEIFDYGDSKVYHYALDYKNIRLTMELDKKFRLEPSFTIVDGTVLGKFISVDVSENEELMAYCN